VFDPQLSPFLQAQLCHRNRTWSRRRLRPSTVSPPTPQLTFPPFLIPCLFYLHLSVFLMLFTTSCPSLPLCFFSTLSPSYNSNRLYWHTLDKAEI
jgi:hypothetical protein